MDTRRHRTVTGGTVISCDELRTTLGVVHVVSTRVCVMSCFVDHSEQARMCGRRMGMRGMTHGRRH